MAVPDLDAMAQVARHGVRRRNLAEGGRDLVVKLRVSRAEKEFLSARAEALGVSVQALLMQAVLTGGTDAAAAYEQLIERVRVARVMLARVGVNVNQLAHGVNLIGVGADGVEVSATEVKSALRELSACVRELDAVAGEVRL